MSTSVTAGGAVLATAIGVGTVGSGAPASLQIAQSAQTLAFTGASHTMLMVMLAILMIVAGLLLNGLSSRHAATSAADSVGAGPPLQL